MMDLWKRYHQCGIGNRRLQQKYSGLLLRPTTGTSPDGKESQWYLFDALVSHWQFVAMKSGYESEDEVLTNRKRACGFM